MKRIYSCLIAAFLLLGLLVGTFPATAQGEEGWIEGTVTTGVFTPVAGATVTVEGTGVTATTDADGEFNVTVEPGTYDVTITCNNYEDETKTGVEVTVNETSSISVSLSKKTGNIVGTVTDSSNGDPIEGVMITEVDNILMMDTTSADGTYKISDVPVGDYTLNCTSLGGYEPMTKDVTVKADQDVTVDFELVPMSAQLVVKVYKDFAQTKGMSGATVTVDGKEKETNAEGVATFEGLDRKSYSVSIKKSGYITHDTTVDLSGGSEELSVTPVEDIDEEGLLAGLMAMGFLFCILPIIIIIVIIVVVIVLLMKRKKKQAPPTTQQPGQQPPGQQPPGQQPPGQQPPGQQPPGQQPPGQAPPTTQQPGQQQYGQQPGQGGQQY